MSLNCQLPIRVKLFHPQIIGDLAGHFLRPLWSKLAIQLIRPIKTAPAKAASIDHKQHYWCDMKTTNSFQSVGDGDYYCFRASLVTRSVPIGAEELTPTRRQEAPGLWPGGGNFLCEISQFWMIVAQVVLVQSLDHELEPLKCNAQEFFADKPGGFIRISGGNDLEINHRSRMAGRPADLARKFGDP